MAIILKMNKKLADMIAAGEVVERPYSVVKELIENSIDARSNKIEVYLVESGLKKIRIIDNGIGMDKEDAVMAFERHATSKLRTEHDLFHINSLGFRGEALPSIASVSDVHLITSEEKGVGTYVNIKAGLIQKIESKSSNRGTDISVNNLFFNTPARFKYLRSPNVELSYISEYINKYALARSDIAFRLVNNDRVLINTNGRNDVLSTIACIYGTSVAKNMLSFSSVNSNFKINGYISKPETTRSTKNYITLIVNGRVVKNYNIIKAIIDGYHTYLPKHRYPIVVLNIEVDPLLIDVNVHPAKLDIKFSQESELRALITDEVQNVLKGKQFIPKIDMSRKDNSIKPKSDYSQEIFNFIEKSKSSISIEEVKEPSFSFEYKKIEQDIRGDKKEEVVKTINEVNNIEYKNEKETKILDVSVTPKIPKLEYIGQLFGTYLLAQNEKGLYIIDQHAAQERIRYEYFLDKFSNVNSDTTDLLVPLNIELSQKEALIVEEELDVLLKMNIQIEKFGINSFVVRSVPTWIKNGEELDTIEKIISYIVNNSNISIGKMRESLAITLSCKTSIKANHYLSTYEANNLIEDLESCKNPYTCPHGRPVIINLTVYEIEKLFKRVM